MKKVILLGLCAAFLLPVLLAGNVDGQYFFFEENPFIGKQMPDVALETIKEDETRLLDEIKDKKSIVFFWATWCPHCRKQIKQMNKITQDFDKDDVNVVLIDIGEPAALVRKFAEKNKIKLPMYVDSDNNSSDIFQIIGVPTYYYINKAGQVVAVEHGLLENYSEVLDQEI